MRRVLRAETRAHGRRVEVTQVQVAEPVNRDAATRAVTTPPRGPRHSTGSPPAMVTLELGMAHGFVGVLMVCRHESTRCQVSSGVVTKVFGYFKVVRRRKTALLRAPALAHPAHIQHDASCVGWRDVGAAPSPTLKQIRKFRRFPGPELRAKTPGG